MTLMALLFIMVLEQHLRTAVLADRNGEWGWIIIIMIAYAVLNDSSRAYRK